MILLSVIIPVFNAETTIARTLQSLNKLSFDSKKVTQIVLVNDGTKDASMRIVREMQAELSPLNTVIVDQENQGLASARNTGLKNSAGEWIFLLDADDELAFDPAPYIRKYPDASALTFSVEYRRDSEPKRIKRPARLNLESHLDVFTVHNALTVSSIAFKKKLVQSFFNADFLSLEDWHLWMMNPLIFENVKNLPDITSAIIHLHGENMSFNAVKMGLYRQRVADNILRNLKDKLTRKQRNNLLIQARIGLLQQGQRIPLNTFLIMPCAFSLYVKLMVYFLLRGNTVRFRIYGN